MIFFVCIDLNSTYLLNSGTYFVIVWFVDYSLIHYHLNFAVLFNIYGPRADPDDVERIQFKHNFFKILQVLSVLKTITRSICWYAYRNMQNCFFLKQYILISMLHKTYLFFRSCSLKHGVLAESWKKVITCYLLHS